MIGLVVIPHSARVAGGTAEVAAQVDGNNARIVPAGGGEDGIGTSPSRIRKDIEEAGDGDGVAVPVDLDSAVMNAELAIETAMDSETVITDAPVLEGTLNAAVKTTSREAMPGSVVEHAEDARDYRKLN